MKILFLSLLAAFGAQAGIPGVLFDDRPRPPTLESLFYKSIAPNDNASALNSRIHFSKNIQDLNDPSLYYVTQKTSATPWSDRRWPMSKGLIGLRYNDAEFSRVSDNDGFQRLVEYVRRTNLKSVASTGDPIIIDKLSPAEKYDLVVGDFDGTLTNRMWGEAVKIYNAEGITNWMGICEGSAAASLMDPEPVQTVTLKTSSGVKVPFHGLDIKALLAMNWSSWGIDISSIGGRCNQSITRDTTDPDCLDTNPGTWHIAALNILGKAQGQLYFDRYAGVEVWNVPLLEYAFTYFNPITKAETRDLNLAMVNASVYEDPYKAKRDQRTKNIVGVKMRVIAGERPATGVAADGSIPLERHAFDYVYDLELSDVGEILGGEWYPKSPRPDFLWATISGMRPTSIGDTLLKGQFIKDDVVPAGWLGAIKSSSRNMQLVRPVLDRLVQLSLAPVKKEEPKPNTIKKRQDSR